jgi:hypothetical protein
MRHTLESSLLPRRVSALLLAGLLAGCGSTAQVTGPAPGTVLSGDGLSIPEAGTPTTGASAAPGVDSGGNLLPGSNPTATGTTTTGVAPKPGGTAGSVSTPVVRGSGSVRVGVLYIDGADRMASALGISGLSTGDARAQAKAVVTHLNATGGLGGRQIELREGKLDSSRMSSDQDGAHAQACLSLTEDQKVSYVISYVQLASNQLACYAKHGVTVLDDQSSTIDYAGAQYAKTFGSPGELALGRAAGDLVDALWRTGWLTSASKVATFVYDTPDGQAIETRYLVPALARHGLTPQVKVRTSNGADGATQGGTVVKLAAKGVDRVIPMGASPLFLMTAAETQNYHPAYAMTSTFGPGALLESAAPRAQLRNAAGIGWSKFLDIGAGTKPGPVSPNETLCFAIMKKAGQQSTSASTQAFQVALCNVLMFLKAGTDAYGVSPDLLTQVRARGLRFGPADAFAIAMRAGRADGAAAYRDLVFDGGCSCFQYKGGNRPAG